MIFSVFVLVKESGKFSFRSSRYAQIFNQCDVVLIKIVINHANTSNLLTKTPSQDPFTYKNLIKSDNYAGLCDFHE